MDIMEHVDISDLIEVKIHPGNLPGQVSVAIICLEKGKNIVIDESALEELNAQVTERVKGMSLNHPNAKGFIKEFVCRLVGALHKNGLAVLEDAEEENVESYDPYGDLRKKYSDDNIKKQIMKNHKIEIN